MEYKNTVWFFGDSFTQNLALREGSLYQEYLNKENIKSWTQIVSEFLNMEEKIIAKGGRSTQSIYFSCINNYQEIKTGDFVIITNSPHVRTVGINKKLQKVSTYNNEQIIYNFPIQEGDIFTCGMPIDVSEQKIILDYILTFILPHKDIWDEYWRTNLQNLKYIFNEKGVKFLFWDYSLWDNFPSIYDETNGKIEDFHWGKLGNIKFSEYIIQQIDKNEY